MMKYTSLIIIITILIILCSFTIAQEPDDKEPPFYELEDAEETTDADVSATAQGEDTFDDLEDGESDDGFLSPSETVETYVLPDQNEDMGPIRVKRPRRRRRKRRRKRIRPTVEAIEDEKDIEMPYRAHYRPSDVDYGQYRRKLKRRRRPIIKMEQDQIKLTKEIEKSNDEVNQKIKSTTDKKEIEEEVPNDEFNKIVGKINEGDRERKINKNEEFNNKKVKNIESEEIKKIEKLNEEIAKEDTKNEPKIEIPDFKNSSKKDSYFKPRRLPPTSFILRQFKGYTQQVKKQNVSEIKNQSTTEINNDRKISEIQNLSEVVNRNSTEKGDEHSQDNENWNVPEPKKQDSPHLKNWNVPEIKDEDISEDKVAGDLFGFGVRNSNYPRIENSSKTPLETQTPIPSSTPSIDEKPCSKTTTEPQTSEDTNQLDFNFDSKTNDEILTLLKSKVGSSKLTEILQSRNMTLNDLIEHRERGSSQRHFTNYIDTNKVETTETSWSRSDDIVDPSNSLKEDETRGGRSLESFWKLFQNQPFDDLLSYTTEPIVVQDSHYKHRKIVYENIRKDKGYLEGRKLPVGIKSAIVITGAIIALAVLSFFVLMVSCKIRQRSNRIKRNAHNMIANHSSSYSVNHNPVILKNGHDSRRDYIGGPGHSNISSNRNYYLWRTLRKTFQYD